MRLNWQRSPTEIHSITKKIIDEGLKASEAFLKQKQVSFADVQKLALSDAAIARQQSEVYFPQYVHPDKHVRDASLECTKQIDKHDIEQSMRVDMYEQLKKVDSAGLKGEDLRLLEKMELSFKRNGLALEESERIKLKALKEELAVLSADFQKNVNEDTTTLMLTKDELSGMSSDFMKTLEVKDDKYVVTMKYPHYVPIMDQCSVTDTRRRLEEAYTTRCKENVQLLETAVTKRRQAAKLLGYPSHSHFVMEVRMAKEPEKALEFLDDLIKRLQPIAQKELAVLQELQSKDSQGGLKSWDFKYYHQKLLQTKYNVNQEEIQKYFQVQLVTKSMLQLYQETLGLKFVQEEAQKWHEDVKYYKVEDAQTSELVGYFYLDLFPRENKYGHAAVFPLVPGFLQEDGTRQYPVCSMVANFPKPTADKPALLSHQDCITYFHEFGHVMHGLLAKTNYARFHGTKVERDFVEAPSQMLENFGWQKDVLQSISCHVETGEKLSDAQIEQMIKAKNVNVALLTLRQVFYAKYDLALHMSQEDLDTTKLFSELRQSISMIPIMKDTCPQATFAHIMGGYDSSYYGYLWSLVFSADMFQTRFSKDRSAAGKDYRKYILQPGGSLDGSDLLKNFLGREPNSQAFFKEMLSSSSSSL